MNNIVYSIRVITNTQRTHLNMANVHYGKKEPPKHTFLYIGIKSKSFETFVFRV